MSRKTKERKAASRQWRERKDEDPSLQAMKCAMEGWTIHEILPGRKPESRVIFVLKRESATKIIHVHGTDMGLWIST